jgi:hypothetical protein
MQVNFLRRAVELGAVCLSIVGLYGCPDTQNSIESTSHSEVIPVVQPKSTDTAVVDFPTQSVPYDVCGEIVDWQRLDLAEQTAELQTNPRYGEALSEEPLKGLFEKFWNESIITFTTYGLSARTEPVFLSGVWTGIEAMDACYEGDRPAAINQGDLAEVWLIGYRITDITWTGSTYQIQVDETSLGLQFVQFERSERNESLPIVILENNGDELTFASGDW